MATPKLRRTDRDPGGRFTAGNPGRPPGRGAGREARRRLARLFKTDPAAATARMQANPLLHYRMVLIWADGCDAADVDLEDELARGRWDSWSNRRAFEG